MEYNTFYNNFAYKQGFNTSNYDNMCVQLIELIQLTLYITRLNTIRGESECEE